MPAVSFDDESVETYRESVRDWIAEFLPQTWRDYQKGGLTEDEELDIRRAWDAALAERRLRCIDWPEEYGGAGLGAIETLVFYEEAARAHAPEELELIGKHLAGPSLLNFGTDEQKAKYLPGIVAGTTVWCEGLSEPNAGSDLAAVITSARLERDTYRIHGRKIWTSFAHYADKCFLLARTSRAAPRRHNLTVLMVDMHQPGVEVVPIRQLNGMHEFNEVVFDGAEVSIEDRLGEEDQGWGIVTIAGTRKLTAPGQAPRRYVHMRHEYDQLLECAHETGVDPDRFAHIGTDLELFLWHLRRIVEAVANGEDFSRAHAITDLYWSELWQELTHAGVDLDCPRHRAFWQRKYVESRPSTLYGGSSELKRNVIANRVLGLPR